MNLLHVLAWLNQIEKSQLFSLTCAQLSEPTESDRQLEDPVSFFSNFQQILANPVDSANLVKSKACCRTMCESHHQGALTEVIFWICSKKKQVWPAILPLKCHKQLPIIEATLRTHSLDNEKPGMALLCNVDFLVRDGLEVFKHTED